MAEQHQVVRKVRRRKVHTADTQNSEDTKASMEQELCSLVDKWGEVSKKIEPLTMELSDTEGSISVLMGKLGIVGTSTDQAEATYVSPPQRTTLSYNVSELFESVAVEDFLSSVKVQKGLAEKVIDPKVLSKCSTSSTSKLGPKTLKIKLIK